LKNTSAIELDTGKVSDRFCGMGRFHGVLRGNGRLNSVITAVFFLNKYNVKTCIYTISALYQMIHLQ